MTKLIPLFNEVKRTFFPRWDTANEWQVCRKTRLTEGYYGNGRCNRKTKKIEINRSYIARDDDELRWLLAHEICHAIVEGNHGLKWQRRFHQVADRATGLRQYALADRIHRDIEMLKTAEKPTLLAIHQNIEDAITGQPDASSVVVIEWVANNWGLTSYGLLKRYKSLKKFFDKAKRIALSERNLWREHHIPPGRN